MKNIKDIPIKKILIVVGLLITLGFNAYFGIIILMNKVESQAIIDVRNQITNNILLQLQSTGEVRINVPQEDGSIGQIILILKPTE